MPDEKAVIRRRGKLVVPANLVGTSPADWERPDFVISDDVLVIDETHPEYAFWDDYAFTPVDRATLKVAVAATSVRRALFIFKRKAVRAHRRAAPT